jgi:methyl-accepting chemotaxis protein
MGADPRERKQIEDEEEFLRILNNAKNEATKEKDKIIEELSGAVEELSGAVEKQAKIIEEDKKTIEELIGRIANLERRFPDQHNEQLRNES